MTQNFLKFFLTLSRFWLRFCKVLRTSVLDIHLFNIQVTTNSILDIVGKFLSVSACFFNHSIYNWCWWTSSSKSYFLSIYYYYLYLPCLYLLCHKNVGAMCPIYVYPSKDFWGPSVLYPVLALKKSGLDANQINLGTSVDVAFTSRLQWLMVSACLEIIHLRLPSHSSVFGQSIGLEP